MRQPDSQTRRTKVLELLNLHPGSSDREIADRLLGTRAPHQPINAICRALQRNGLATRKARQDGRIGTYPAQASTQEVNASVNATAPSWLEGSEDWIKRAVQQKLMEDGWNVTVAFGRTRGCDITADRGDERWYIEAKGNGKHSTMRHNFFLAVMGQLAFCFSTQSFCKHSIALPRHSGYERLWERVSSGWKARLGISVLFVDSDGLVTESE